MGLVVFLGSFLATYIAGRQSAGRGLAMALAVGYVTGVMRANLLGVFTTLMFDAALGGLYLSRLGTLLQTQPGEPAGLRQFLVLLMIWPTLLLIVPVHDPLIQLVGWRAEAWMLPLVLLGATMSMKDLRTVALASGLLNLMAFAVAIYLYFRGIEVLYPRNAVTEIIYNSRDVAGGYARIPSTFLSAHAYGGAMLVTLPVLLGGLAETNLTFLRRAIYSLGAMAACGGILLCAARQPIVVLFVSLALVCIRTGLSVRAMAWSLALVVVVAIVASSNPRLQRFFELADTDAVRQRARGSANISVVNLMLANPMGAGLGAGAPSIPYFLRDRAPRVETAENEYARLVIDIGWPGLVLWLAFLIWLYTRRQRWSLPDSISRTVLLSHAVTLTTWGLGFIGTGVLTSIPSSACLLLQMGMIAQGTTARSEAGS